MIEQKLDSKGPKIFSQIGGRDVVCFNFGGDNLKLACGRITSHGFELVDIINVEIRGFSDDDISQAIRKHLDQLKLSSPEVVNLISAHFAITKDIEIPTQNPDEIREILELQATRHTPYSQEEIIIDYMTVGSYKESYIKIIFVIVPLNVVRKQISIFQKANLKIEKVFFATEAMGQMCSCLFNLQEKDSVQTIIHMDRNFTDFMNVSKGRLIYMRSIPIGAEQMERYQARFVEEIKKSIEAYQGGNIDRDSEEYILTGASIEIHSLLESLSQAVDKPVRFLSYWEHLPFASDRVKQMIPQGGESFLDVASALMAMNQLKVNLIPPEIKLKKSFEKKSEDLVKTGILIMILLFLICLIFINQFYLKTTYLKNLAQKYQSSLQRAKDLDKDFSRMKLIKKFLEERDVPLGVLAELYNLIPADVRFTSIKYDGHGKFAIEGNARTMATVFSFITAMEGSPYFEKGEPKRTTKRKEGDEEVVDFEIVCLIEGKFKSTQIEKD